MELLAVSFLMGAVLFLVGSKFLVNATRMPSKWEPGWRMTVRRSGDDYEVDAYRHGKLEFSFRGKLDVEE